MQGRKSTQREKSSLNVWHFVLGFALVAIVGLTAGIVAVRMNSGEEPEPEPAVTDEYNEGFSEDEAERYIPTEEQTSEPSEEVVGTDA